MIKIKDIAKQAGVSVATVSLVINSKPGVSQATRERVLNLIKETGYVPSLTKIDNNKRRNSIRYLMYKKYGIVVDENGFVASLTDGINLGAQELGYDVIITTINESNKDSVLDMALEDPKDGIILLGTELLSEDLAFLSNFNCPIVIVDNYFEFENYDSVVMNNVGAVYTAVEYLHNKGFDKIGHFESTLNTSNFAERKEGYIKALNKLNLEYKPKYTFKLKPTMNGAYKDMVKILENNPELPNAIFSDNDTIAVGAIKALTEFGIKVPEQVSIVGFDDIPFCKMIEPKLTTMRIFKEKIGQMAVRRLVEKIESNDDTVVKVRVGADLIERKSTI